MISYFVKHMQDWNLFNCGWSFPHKTLFGASIMDTIQHCEGCALQINEDQFYIAVWFMNYDSLFKAEVCDVRASSNGISKIVFRLIWLLQIFNDIVVDVLPVQKHETKSHCLRPICIVLTFSCGSGDWLTRPACGAMSKDGRIEFTEWTTAFEMNRNADR